MKNNSSHTLCKSHWKEEKGMEDEIDNIVSTFRFVARADLLVDGSLERNIRNPGKMSYLPKSNILLNKCQLKH